MLVHIKSEYTVEPSNEAEGGFSFTLRDVIPYTKDLGGYEKACENEKRFDISNWAFFIAFDADGNPCDAVQGDSRSHLPGTPIGAITMAAQTQGVDMLDGRSDLAVLWDLRVREEYRQLGLGTRLFTAAVQWARQEGYKQLKIECQNNNVAACRFYQRQGAILKEVNKGAYADDPALKDEVQLIWYLDL